MMISACSEVHIRQLRSSVLSKRVFTGGSTILSYGVCRVYCNLNNKYKFDGAQQYTPTYYLPSKQIVVLALTVV